MSKINVNLIREYLTPWPIFPKNGEDAASFWKLAFYAAGFGEKFSLPSHDELRWLVKLVQSPLVGNIGWTLHEDSEGGTWLGDTPNQMGSYHAWTGRDVGVMTNSNVRDRVFVGSTADDAKCLAQMHWSMTILSGLTDDFLVERLELIAVAKNSEDY